MKVLKIIGGIVAVIVIAVAIAVMVMPSTANLDRSIVINKNPKTIFAMVNSMKKLNSWSPWTEIDTSTVYQFEGPDEGVGSKMSWTSDHPDVGNGSQWIIASTPNEMVSTQLEFADFENPSIASFHLEPVEGGTKVTWDFNAEFDGVYKLMIPMMDKMLGESYESGLANLKRIVEAMPDSPDIQISIEERDMPLYYIGVKSEIAADDMEGFQKVMADTYSTLSGFMSDNNMTPAGRPICVYHDLQSENIVIEPAFPTTDLEIVDHDKIESSEIGATKVIKAVHFGDYSKLGETHEAIVKYISENQLEASGNPWEIYINEPGSGPMEEWETHVFYPIN